jgi:hypothetical protein
MNLVIEHTFYRNGIPLNFPDVKRKKAVLPFVPCAGT